MPRYVLTNRLKTFSWEVNRPDLETVLGNLQKVYGDLPKALLGRIHREMTETPGRIIHFNLPGVGAVTLREEKRG